MVEAWISIGLTKIASTVNPAGEDYTEGEIFDEIEAACTQGGILKMNPNSFKRRFRVTMGRHGDMTYTPPLWVSWQFIWNDWLRILDRIPVGVRETARAEPHFKYDYGNALRMMYLMAPQWGGKRLGVREQGRLFPITAKEKLPSKASKVIVFLNGSDYQYGRTH